MAEIFRVAPRGRPLTARAGDWLWITGVPHTGHTFQYPAADRWVVNHNLGRYPAAISVRTLGGVVCDVMIEHKSQNELWVNFDVPTAGAAPAQVDTTADTIDTTIARLVELRTRMTTGVASNTLTISQGYAERVCG